MHKLGLMAASEELNAATVLGCWARAACLQLPSQAGRLSIEYLCVVPFWTSGGSQADVGDTLKKNQLHRRWNHA